MREEIGRRFVERSFSWWPYLYPDLDDHTSEADETAGAGNFVVRARPWVMKPSLK